MAALLQCPGCKTPFLPPPAGARVSCSGCGVQMEAEVFPALFRPQTSGSGGEQLLIESDASCFYHPQKKAVIPCHGCGRFLCGLCDCELNGQHFCPACLETGRKKGKIKNLQNERTLYDSLTLTIAVAPLLIFYFTIVTAPMALFMAIRFWKAPLGIVRRSRWRFVVAIVFAVAEIIGWGIGIYFIVNLPRNG